MYTNGIELNWIELSLWNGRIVAIANLNRIRYIATQVLDIDVWRWIVAIRLNQIVYIVTGFGTMSI